MKASIQGLRKDLSQVQELFDQGTFLSFSSEEKRELVAGSRKLMGKLDALTESFLTIGLIGGTGVGKSSIMNALAGSAIASTSHRRPHTDQILIYRHASADLPAELQRTSVPWREITHEAEGIRQIILCDLPDFDSLVGAHHERVVRFLEHLDVLVWVTSPEKYADGRFYAFLRDVPKARQNFYFVLNKVDLFFQDQDLNNGYDQLARVTASFQRHLQENGIAHPILYTLSAGEAMQSETLSPWNQFAGFRHQVFQLREAKEVLSIKSANLDVEVSHFLTALEKEKMSLEIVRQTLEELIRDLEEGRAEWMLTGKMAFDAWIENRLRAQMLDHLANTLHLVGPGRLIAAVAQEWQRWRQRQSSESFQFVTEDGPTGTLQRHLERVDNKMAHRLLYRGLPAEMVQRVESVPAGKETWEGLVKRLEYFMQGRLAHEKSISSRGFRLVQYGIYGLLTIGFLLAMGGEAPWRNLLEHPGWSSMVRVMLGIIASLFSPIGLAALGSYLLLQLFLGFYFYGRYRKFLQRRLQKFIESLKAELARIWEEELNAMIARLRAHAGELESQLLAIADLHESHRQE